MITIEVFESDKLYNIDFTLKDADSVAVDLTNGTPIVLRAQLEGATGTSMAGNIVVGTAITGECYYEVQENDFSAPGRYQAEVEVTFTGGKVITFGDIVVIVKRQLPRTI